MTMEQLVKNKEYANQFMQLNVPNEYHGRYSRLKKVLRWSLLPLIFLGFLFPFSWGVAIVGTYFGFIWKRNEDICYRKYTDAYLFLSQRRYPECLSVINYLIESGKPSEYLEKAKIECLSMIAHQSVSDPAKVVSHIKPGELKMIEPTYQSVSKSPSLTISFTETLTSTDDTYVNFHQSFDDKYDPKIGMAYLKHCLAYKVYPYEEMRSRLSNLRANTSMSTSAVAKSIGISPSTLSSCEGGHATPRDTTVSALANYYDVPKSFLISGWCNDFSEHLNMRNKLAGGFFRSDNYLESLYFAIRGAFTYFPDKLTFEQNRMCKIAIDILNLKIAYLPYGEASNIAGEIIRLEPETSSLFYHITNQIRLGRQVYCENDTCLKALLTIGAIVLNSDSIDYKKHFATFTKNDLLSFASKAGLDGIRPSWTKAAMIDWLIENHSTAHEQGFNNFVSVSLNPCIARRY